jgi:hypothetical protein
MAFSNVCRVYGVVWRIDDLVPYFSEQKKNGLFEKSSTYLPYRCQTASAKYLAIN